MYTGKTKKFRDTIHGYIEIPEIIVSEIIDSELFQRLRHIEQTSVRPLYPAARHDRFIHSLGVYQLGKQAFTNFKRNSQSELHTKQDKREFSEEWWDKQQLLFELACLLHDCAHAPFSHTLEDLYNLQKANLGDKNHPDLFGFPRNTKISELDYALLSVCTPLDSSFTEDFLLQSSAMELKGKGAPHEKMSSYCVINEFKDSICKIANAYKVTLIAEDYIFMVRMIIGCHYSKDGKINSIKNCIISMLNSSSIDVDGLDYIVRDAYMSGIDNFSIDYQRLLSSFTIIPVQVIKTYSCQNLSLDGIWLKDSTFSIEELSVEDLQGRMTIQDIDSYNKNNIKAIGEEITVSCVYNSKTDTTTRIKLLRCGTMQIQETCTFEKSNFSGTIHFGKRIVQGHNAKNSKIGSLEYILGFDKNSLSIIQSTVEARNHEYLWVYTHPKVLYSANYLQCELLRDSAKYLCCLVNNSDFSKEKLDFSKCSSCTYCTGEDCASKGKEEDYLLYILGYETYFSSNVCSQQRFDENTLSTLTEKGFLFYQTNDDDLNALFKRIYLENQRRGNLKSDKLERDFKEFFFRSHRKAIWKSFIEYNNFLNKHDISGSIIPSLCNKAVSQSSIYNNYGSLSPDKQAIFDQYGMKNVLIIKSSVKTKVLNPNDTFIKFKDQSLRLYDVFDKTILKEKMTKEFFYIFADITKPLTSTQYRDLIEKLKT